MAEDQTKKPVPEDDAPAEKPDELAQEDLKKVTGGASELYHKARQTKVRSTGGVDASAPVEPQPSPSINFTRK